MSRDDFVIDASEVKRFVKNLVAVDANGNKRQFNTVHVVDASGNKKKILPNELVRGLSETLNLSESTVLELILNLASNEDITLSESWGRDPESRTTQKGISESLTLSESTVLDFIKSLSGSDSMSLSGQLGRYVDSRTNNSGLSESVVLSESTSLTIAKTITASETINLSEQIGKFVEERTPSAPSNLTASEPTCSGSQNDVELTFDDNSDNEDTWNVYKDGSLFDTVSSSTTSTTGQVTITAVNIITSGETADFTVSAENSAGESSETSPDSVSFRDTANQPNNVSASWNTLICNVTVSWDEVSNACEYYIYRDGTQIGTNTDPTNTAFNDSNANAETSYTYEVEASNDHGISSAGSDSITTGTCDGPS